VKKSHRAAQIRREVAKEHRPAPNIYVDRQDPDAELQPATTPRLRQLASGPGVVNLSHRKDV
jgi:hypothetical protein